MLLRTEGAIEHQYYLDTHITGTFKGQLKAVIDYLLAV